MTIGNAAIGAGSGLLADLNALERLEAASGWAGGMNTGQWVAVLLVVVLLGAGAIIGAGDVADAIGGVRSEYLAGVPQRRLASRTEHDAAPACDDPLRTCVTDSGGACRDQRSAPLEARHRHPPPAG